MKRKYWLQSSLGLALVALLVALVVMPAMAQDPEAEEDVEAQLSFHGGFSLNPFSDLLDAAGTGGGVAVTQVAPSGGRATTEFTVLDVEDLYSLNLAFDYDGDVVMVADVRPGSLFDDYTEGVDFHNFFDPISCNVVAPKDPGNEYVLPIAPDRDDAAGLVIPPPTDPRRCYVNIALTDFSIPPVRGNGSLIRIDWDVQDVGVDNYSEVDFTIASLLDEFGNRLEPCIGPGAPCDNARPDPSIFDGPGPDDPFLFADFVIGLLKVGPHATSLDFQVALEGGKSPVAAPAVDVAVTDLGLTSNFTPSAGGAVQTSGAGTLPYDSVEITRPGYMRYVVSDVSGFDPSLITLIAGDVNEDDVINIFDVMLVAANFNLPVTANNEKMNFNADTRITIVDLALIAKNYGVQGPSPIAIGPTPTVTPTPCPGRC